MGFHDHPGPPCHCLSPPRFLDGKFCDRWFPSPLLLTGRPLFSRVSPEDFFYRLLGGPNGRRSFFRGFPFPSFLALPLKPADHPRTPPPESTLFSPRRVATLLTANGVFKSPVFFLIHYVFFSGDFWFIAGLPQTRKRDRLFFPSGLTPVLLLSSSRAPHWG